jgi:hypothetical protein
MSNVDLFELFAARTFAICYEHFPLPKQISPEELSRGADHDGVTIEHARQVAGHTLIWLCETGYLKKLGESPPFRYVLSPKGFEILNASPFSTPETTKTSAPGAEASAAEKRTLGEQLTASAKEILTSAGKEEAKSLIQQIIGWGVRAGLGATIATLKVHAGL